MTFSHLRSVCFLLYSPFSSHSSVSILPSRQGLRCLITHQVPNFHNIPMPAINGLSQISDHRMPHLGFYQINANQFCPSPPLPSPLNEWMILLDFWPPVEKRPRNGGSAAPLGKSRPHHTTGLTGTGDSHTSSATGPPAISVLGCYKAKDQPYTHKVNSMLDFQYVPRKTT